MFISTHQLFYADHLPQENNKTDKMLPKKIPVFFPIVQLILLQMINLSTIILETQQHQHIHETLHAEPVIP